MPEFYSIELARVNCLLMPTVWNYLAHLMSGSWDMSGMNVGLEEPLDI